MRVTSSMYYNNIYGKNNSNLNQKLFDVNKQISSGLKIQNASDDVAVFAHTMLLDNEITTLEQIKASTQNGFKMSNQTDTVMTQFDDLLNRFKTLLIQGANDTNDEISLNAIAGELRGIEKNLRSLANTSINGKFLFAGSAVDTKPIDDNGIYQGNSDKLNALAGSQNLQQFNLSGAELFLGESKTANREITTNVVNRNLLQDYPELQSSDDDAEDLTAQSTMRQLMGDIDEFEAPSNLYHFYLQGTKSDGSNFKSKLSFSDTNTVDELLDAIGVEFGNTAVQNVVNVSLSSDGQIQIEDKRDGSSKLDFNMVGAVDFSGGTAADISASTNNLIDLNDGETDFSKIVNGISTAVNPNLYVKEFVKSGFTSASGTPTLQGLVYDNTLFSTNGAQLSSNVAQVVRETNELATPKTKLSEVFDLSQGTADTLDGTQLRLQGDAINGTAYDVTIDLNSSPAGSTFSLDGGVTNYNIYNMDPAGRAPVDADEMSYQQLLDVINMVVTNNIPSGAPASSATQYDVAIESANIVGKATLSYDGKITFQDLTSGTTKASMALYDANSGDFSADASVMTFQANNALTVNDPRHDFFNSIDEMIRSIEEYKNYPDTESGSERVMGIENSIARVDDLLSHFSAMHAKVGAQSNTLDEASQRIDLLSVSTQTLRSEVVDTDIAQAALMLQQLTLNYQAMLSTVGRVSQLSLVNYL